MIKLTEILDEIRLDEKLITYNDRKPYGQVVFLVGGAGGGKGFAKDNFIDSGNYKDRDVDEMKKQLQKLHRIGHITIDQIFAKFGDKIPAEDAEIIRNLQAQGYNISKLDLKQPDHVRALHALVRAMGIKDKTLANLLASKSNPETLPNLLFDITGSEHKDFDEVLPDLVQAGYKPENIHLTWVLTDYVTALHNNKQRPRMVPEKILLKTHIGASETVWDMVTKSLNKDINGRVDVILNNPENTIYWKDSQGNDVVGPKGQKYPSGFLTLKVKLAGKPILPRSTWFDTLYNWIKQNAPEQITSRMD